nr:hypothetical protein [Tanacetum cinerariifolium]
DCSCLKGNVEDKILIPKLPENYARCGHPVNGPYCQGCALLLEKLEEDLVTYLKYFQDTSESSDDTESDEFIKSCVENLVPNPSESEGENGCDVPSCFTTFSNILFDANYDFKSVDDQSLHNEDSDLVEYILNRDSSVISSSSKINSLLDEFIGELTLLKSIPPGIDKADCHPKNEIRFSERLLYDNPSPRPPKEFVFEKIDLSFNLDGPMSPSIKDDDNVSKGDILFLEILLHDDPIPLPDTLDFSNFPGLSHRCGTFKKFNTRRSHLNESPMEMLFSTYCPLIKSSMGELGQAK